MSTLRTIKHFWWLAVLIFCAPSAWGFALLGPLANGGDSWQTGTLGYGLAYTELLTAGGPEDLGDIGGPKNIAEGYRRNSPVLYYAYDANFLDYFGSNGVAAVNSAVAIMNFSMTNNSLGNLDGYSAGLSEFPPESLHVNYEAQSLALTDLKSVTLHCLVEQLGLAEPERYTWTLAERSGNPCPSGVEYLVLQRNFGITPSAPDQLQYSSYVNDTLYSYGLIEECAGTPTAYTVPFAVDPDADEYTAVAANTYYGLGISGGYYSGLTRDDVGGLRYLLNSNNIVWETPAFVGAAAATGTGAADLLTTNFGSLTFVTTSNLNTLLVFAQTNTPAATTTAFGVTVTSSNFYPIYVTNWNYYLSTPYGAPYGTQILSSNIASVTLQEAYTMTFGNVITNGNLAGFPGIIQDCTNVALYYSPTTPALLETTSFSQENGAPYGSLGTNTTEEGITLDEPSGEYFTLPNTTSNQCGWEFLCQQPGWSVTYLTNVIGSATNTSTGFVGSESIVTAFTNHTYAVKPIICNQTPFATNLYEGIEKVLFTNADYDSLIGQFFQPITNYYTMTMVTNSQSHVETFERIVTAPDVLLTAADDIAANTFDGTVIRNITFDVDNIGAGLAGPGTINPRTTISYNKVGAAFENEDFVGPVGVVSYEYYQIPVVQWASFGPSTNDPVLYPNGTSIQNLENQILVQVTPAPPNLPNGTNGVPYATTNFTASGGAFSPPFTWQVLSGLGALPPGLSLSSGGVLSGTPTKPGTFDFTVQMTDSLGRSVTWYYTIVIN